MLDIQLNRDEFDALAVEVLKSGRALRFRARGTSMHPFIQDGDILEIEPSSGGAIRVGDVVLFQHSSGCLLAHRVVRVVHDGGQTILVQGDALHTADGLVQTDQVLGRVVVIERDDRRINIGAIPQRLLSRLWVGLDPLSKLIYHKMVAVKRRLRSAMGR